MTDKEADDSSGVQPPQTHVDAEGWLVSVYADGTRTRQKTVGDALMSEFPASWQTHGVPPLVQEQDLAAMREAGRQFAMQREKAFFDAFFGPGWDTQRGE